MFKTENYNNMLLEKTVIGLALCRMNGDLVYVNDAFSKLIGRSTEEVLQLTYWQLTPEKYEIQEKAQLKSLEQNKRYGPYEKEYIHADGRLIPVRLSGQIVEIDGVDYIWSSVEDITDRKQIEAELAHLYQETKALSLRDGLTGVANRRMFDEVLKKEWKRAQRSGLPLSLVIFDIDYFKQYNDHYGHLKGDDCLKQISAILARKSKRSSDLLARYGGEEFVLLLAETTETQAYEIAVQCIKAVQNKKMEHKHSLIADILTISAGVSSIIPFKESKSSALINTADELLYQAKRKGRNRVEYLPE
jgi:diguanylate cyclase (GGDEF)-like protein/PAS domain S-box-containing protein